MKLKFGFKNIIDAHFESDVESLVEKNLEYKSKRPAKKTRYQIKQEEKRKNKELEHKQFIQGVLIMIGLIAFLLIICAIGNVFELG
ncbi:MAG: hypothetical protein IJ512_06615 [Ruminococcus sp.]|nr:hypothetical protein [Ruminococcus sp.]